MRRVAIVGSGVAGLAAAQRLKGGAQVTLFEAGRHFGGHVHTVDVSLEGHTCGVDTGFLVFNPRTYPGLLRLFGALEVPTAAAEMSFSVQLPRQGLEWSGVNLNAVFAQRRNLLRPRFLGMLRDVLRFNRLATALAEAGDDAALAQPLGEFLAAHRFGEAFRDGYFLPMIGCIWSCPTDQMLAFPVGTLIRFCHNHGLLQVEGRPQWYTVRGGARQYVQKILREVPQARLDCPVLSVRRQADGVEVISAAGREVFDDVVLACHSDQALALLPQASEAEHAVLGAVRYQPNRAVLHTDTGLLPRRRRAWAAWNYEHGGAEEASRVCVHYLLNRLQPLPWHTPTLVSLNPVREPRADQVLARIDYAHPVFDSAAIAAQRRLPGLQGQGGVWFCGAWTRYGFHEDGLQSGWGVAEALLARHSQSVLDINLTEAA